MLVSLRGHSKTNPAFLQSYWFISIQVFVLLYLFAKVQYKKIVTVTIILLAEHFYIAIKTLIVFLLLYKELLY